MRSVNILNAGKCINPMRSVFFFILCCFLGIVRSDGSTRIDLNILLGDASAFTESIEVPHDAVFKSPKRYRGINIKRLIERRGVVVPENATNTTVVFHCSDGYTSITTLDLLFKDKAFLAVADADAPDGRSWLPIPSSGGHEPGPFFLVWPGLASDDNKHPWPYGVTAIEIDDSNTILASAAPEVTAGFEEGFGLFKNHCMSCHSVNGVGGTVGVELNVPRNIFEYWKPNMLPEFVVDPRSFRLNGKMPGFAHLDKAEIKKILGYLEHMKDHKKNVPPP